MLTYATYNLLNWRRIDPNAPVELGNIVCINNFLGGQDEEHFRCVHIDIEARAAPAIARLLPMQDAAQRVRGWGLGRHGVAKGQGLWFAVLSKG